MIRLEEMQLLSRAQGWAHSRSCAAKNNLDEEETEVKIVERRYVSRNGVIERTRFVVGDNASIRRGRHKANSERRQEQNDRSALRRLARTLNCNIEKGDGSLLISLDYSEDELEKLISTLPEEQQRAVGTMREPKTWRKTRPEKDETLLAALAGLVAAAEKKLSAWIRKLRKICTVRFASVTSYTDGDTGELVRLHHHVVLMGCGKVSLDALTAVWQHGGTDVRHISGQADYTPVAVYLLRQARRVKKDGKLYRVSRGLEVPVVEEREVTGRSDMVIPAQAVVFERSEYNVDAGPMQGQYARYILAKTKKQRKLGLTVEGGDPDAV